MTLKILPLEPSDCDRWAAIYQPAFSAIPIGQAMWHSQFSPSSMQGFADLLRAGLSKPNTHTFKVIDTSLNNQLIAVSKWSVYTHPRTPEEVEANLVVRPTWPEENRQAREEAMVGIFNSRRNTMGGKPHVILELLLTDPEHQRRGAGRMLVMWGVEKGEELGLPVYLEGSVAGAPLYRSVGFEEVGEIRWDGRRYGAREVDVHKVMIRQPKKASTAFEGTS